MLPSLLVVAPCLIRKQNQVPGRHGEIDNTLDGAWPSHSAVEPESTRVVWSSGRLVVSETSAVLAEPPDLPAVVIRVEVEVAAAAGTAVIHTDVEGVAAVALGAPLLEAPAALGVVTPAEAQVVLPRAPPQASSRVWDSVCGPISRSRRALAWMAAFSAAAGILGTTAYPQFA